MFTPVSPISCLSRFMDSAQLTVEAVFSTPPRTVNGAHTVLFPQNSQNGLLWGTLLSHCLFLGHRRSTGHVVIV